MPRPPTRPVEELIASGKRIYSCMSIVDKNIKKLPPTANSDTLTVFIEPEDILYHTFLCDENLGYIGKPTARDPDKELFLQEHRMPVLFYERPGMREFLEFLKQ